MSRSMMHVHLSGLDGRRQCVKVIILAKAEVRLQSSALCKVSRNKAGHHSFAVSLFLGQGSSILETLADIA